MAFPPSFLDELRMRLPPSQVIARRVRLVRKGREFQGLCPFHNEKTPSFTVNDDKGFFHCFGCGAHGDVIGFTMRAEGVEFREAVERLARDAGLEVPIASPAERRRVTETQELLTVVEAACSWFERQLRSGSGQPGLDYLRARGLSDTTITEFRLGWAPDRRVALKQALMATGFNEEMLIRAGLLSRPAEGGESFDFFRGRVIFPIMDARGRPIAFGGRVLGNGEPKYLNSRDTPLFDKGRSVYAQDRIRSGVRAGEALILVEGYMDVISLHQAGFRGAVAPLGTALTETQIQMLWRVSPEIHICFDGDDAGKRAVTRAAKRIFALWTHQYSVKCVKMPDKVDPDELVKDRTGVAVFRRLIESAKPLSKVVWESFTVGRSFDSPEAISRLEGELEQEWTRIIPDRVVQSNFRRQVKFWIRDELGPWGRYKKTLSKKSDRFNLKSSGYFGEMEKMPYKELLVAIINHPEVVEYEYENIISIDIPDMVVLSAVQDAISIISNLDSPNPPDVKIKLGSEGYSELLAIVLRPVLYSSANFCAPAATFDEVRRGIRFLAAMSRKRRMKQEVEDLVDLLKRDMSIENFEKLRLLQLEIDSLVEAGLGNEGDGAGSVATLH